MECPGIVSQKDKKVLLMLSGGRDSFLSACYLIERGYEVNMVTFYNGHMSCIELVQDVAARLIKRYGEERAKFVGIHSIIGTLYHLYEPFIYKTPKELVGDYPDLLPSQIFCLACHTAMYVRAIAYCKHNNISVLAEGARFKQGFFVELPEMVERYSRLADANGIQLELPVYHLQSDWDRKLAMADRGFLPKTYEPQCWLGCPLRGDLTTEQRDSLTKYFDMVMYPILISIHV